jgi:hypothetical protein
MRVAIGLAIAAMIVSFAGLVGSAGSTSPTVQSAPATGTHCTVHLRRDALGPWGQGITDPAVSILGQAGWIDGSFGRMNDNWLILTRKDGEHWIPRDMILLLEVGKK